MTLPIDVEVYNLDNDITAPVSLPHTRQVVLEQPKRTGFMLVNPYNAYDPIPAAVTLTPAVDRWTETITQWTSEITSRLNSMTINTNQASGMGLGNSAGSKSVSTSSTSNYLVSSFTQALPFLRQIDVKFDVKGFGPKEELLSLTFDGIPLTPSA